MIGAVQVCVSVGRRGDGEFRATLATSMGLRPASSHHLAAITYIQLVEEPVVCVKVNEHPVRINGRCAVVGVTCTKRLRPDDCTIVGVKRRQMSVLTLYENEVSDSTRGVDVRQQDGSAVRIVSRGKRYVEEQLQARNIGCVERGLDCVVGSFIGRNCELQPIGFSWRSRWGSIRISPDSNRKL